ncbi:MAG: hypothetical protein AAF938_27500 [Myxococcota bacterium]
MNVRTHRGRRRHPSTDVEALARFVLSAAVMQHIDVQSPTHFGAHLFTRLRVQSLFGLALACLSLAACGDDSGASCVEGTSQSCACVNGEAGAQVCRGGAFEACVCGGDDAGTPDAFVADMVAPLDAFVPDAMLDAPAVDMGALDAAPEMAAEMGPPAPVCGNRRLEDGEECDDGNRRTESCPYGTRSCTVCTASCREAPGATTFCGDGVQQTREDCDGSAICDDACGFLGEAFEPNDDVDDALRLEADEDGNFAHPIDTVAGPTLFADGMFMRGEPDYFQIPVCNGGTLQVRIEFTNARGNLDLLVGRRAQSSSGGRPPVTFFASSQSIRNDFEEVVLDAPTPDQIPRTHYIRVEVDDEARDFVRNAYTLTGSISGCPE